MYKITAENTFNVEVILTNTDLILSTGKMTKYYRIFFIFLEINYLDMRFCISVHFVHCLQTSHTVHTIMEKEHSYLSPIKRPLQHVNYLNMAPLCIRKQI